MNKTPYLHNNTVTKHELNNEPSEDTIVAPLNIIETISDNSKLNFSDYNRRIQEEQKKKLNKKNNFRNEKSKKKKKAKKICKVAKKVVVIKENQFIVNRTVEDIFSNLTAYGYINSYN